MSTTDLAQQVADLTTATTKLTEEVVGQKDRLTAAADTATGKATDASGSAQAAAQSVTDAAAEVTKATNQANTAEAEADRAKTEADRATEVSGLDTVEQAVDMALGEFAGLMTESEARAIQWQNENVNFDASGFVHMGKHRDKGGALGTPVNDGMWVYPSTGGSNELLLGGVSGQDRVVGSSKTDFPVAHIAGAVCNVLHRSSTVIAQATANFLLPEAEDGTRIYDSTGNARGSGKASLDLKVDTDPKYGDVPTGTEDEILREAVGRAFEGLIRNGDFRNGDNGEFTIPNATGASLVVTTSGLTAQSGSTSNMLWVSKGAYTFEAGATYEVIFHNLVINQTSTLRIGGYNPSEVVRSGSYEKYVHTVTVEAESATVYFYGSGAGATCSMDGIEIRRIISGYVTEEVVTHPVDLVGLEYYEEELTGRQEIFECIQSLSTTFGKTSVPTVLSTRKLSYFQQYDGQFPEVTADPDYINDRYRCVVWDDLTEPQKREVAAYMGEKLFVGVNGHIVNGRLRARTIRGLGNGDWRNVDSNGETSLRYDGSSLTTVKGQGSYDTTDGLSTHYDETHKSGSHNTHPKVGAFTARSATGVAYQGRCFFYVVASIPRANQGAYHADLNPWGCALWGSTIDANYAYPWHNSSPPNDQPKNTLADCFVYKAQGKDTGSIISRISGHPDGIFYDGIEAGGLNGIIDWRLPAVANDSPEEAAKVEAKVENGTYRGLEKLVRTKFYKSDAPMNFVGNSPNNSYFYAGGNMFPELLVAINTNYSPTSQLLVVDSAGTVHAEVSHIQRNATHSYMWFSGTVTGLTTGDVYLVWVDEINLSVSGEFGTQMVIGDPANILQTDALKDGWLGTWCPIIPDGVKKGIEFTRKFVNAPSNVLSTTDNGSTWSVISESFDSTNNERANGHSAIATGLIQVYSYKAFAKQTKPSTNKPVYNGKAGLMDVFATCSFSSANGVLLGESLIGKVMTNDNFGNSVGSYGIDFISFQGGKISLRPSYGLPRHSQLLMAPPSNNSHAFKVLPYQISNNGQGSIGYQANELTWSASAFTTIDGSTSLSYSTATQYYVKGGYFSGRTFVCTQALSNKVLDNEVYMRPDGNLYRIANDSLAFVSVGVLGNWGDDSTIKITADGSDTFVDLNGNTQLSVVHELAIPYTWTSNHARAGQQVEGVDL